MLVCFPQKRGHGTKDRGWYENEGSRIVGADAPAARHEKERFQVDLGIDPYGENGTTPAYGQFTNRPHDGRRSIRHLIRRPACGGSPADTFPSRGRLAGASVPAGETGTTPSQGPMPSSARVFGALGQRVLRGGTPLPARFARHLPRRGRPSGIRPGGSRFADGNTDCMSAWRMIEYSKKAARRRRGLVRRRNRRTQRGEDQP